MPGVSEVARNLQAVRWIEGSIENDLKVYQHVIAVFAAAP